MPGAKDLPGSLVRGGMPSPGDTSGRIRGDPVSGISNGDRGAVDQITWSDFEKVEIRVGRIVQADVFPQARKPAYRLRIDFGELGVKSSSAQITTHYRVEELVGRLVLGVVNFPPRQIANFFSEVLTLGVIESSGDVVLIGPDRDVPLGLRIA